METLLTLQIQISLAILLTLLVRCCLTRLPRRWSYGLWIIVFLRLLIPVSLESPLGVLPGEAALGRIWQQASAGEESENMWGGEQDVHGRPADGGKEPGLTENSEGQDNSSKGMAEDGVTAAGHGRPSALTPEAGNHGGYGLKPDRADTARLLLFCLWLAGLLIVLGYNLRAALSLRRQTRGAEMLEEGVFCCPKLTTPFVTGLFSPRIYLPASMKPKQRAYVLCHERIHIRRRDYLIKGIAFLLTAFSWYNPLVWVAFYMLEQDMEMSCDEAVVESLGDDIRKAYSQSLLDFAASGREAVMAPPAFGENSVRQRVRNVLRKKRSRWWCALAGGAAVAAVAALVFTTRGSGGQEPSEVRDKAAKAQYMPSEKEDSFEERAAEIEYEKRVIEEIERQLREDPDYQQYQYDHFVYPALKPGDQVTRLPEDVYGQIADREGNFYINTRYGIYRRDTGADADIYTCLFPRYIGPEARMTLHPNQDMLYFVTDSQYEEWSLDWYIDCIMRLDLHTLKTEIVALSQEGPHQDWQDQIDAFYGVYNGKNGKQKSHAWEEMVQYHGEELSAQYELARSLEADVADCPGEETIEIYVLKEDSQLQGMYGGVVRIWSAAGDLLMTETADPVSPGRNSLYVGRQDGQDFLMNFYLEDRGTFGCYLYQIYRLTADGEIQQINDSRFEWDYDESLGEKALLYNDEVFREWAEKLQAYMEASQLLLSTLEDEVETDPEVRPYRYNYDTLTRGHTGEGLKGRQ